MPFKIGPDRDRLDRLNREIERMVALFPDLGVQKALLFGSAARGDVIGTSDIDLILIKETDKRFIDRVEEALLALEPAVDLDVLVYTPAEFEDLLESSPFVQAAVRDGRVLYEA